MCGRFIVTSAPEAIRALFRYPEQPNFPPRYNVAPTRPLAIVRLHEGQRHIALVRWGLLPSWVKHPKAFTLLINARGKSVCDKPAFRAAMKPPDDLLEVYPMSSAVKRVANDSPALLEPAAAGAEVAAPAPKPPARGRTEGKRATTEKKDDGQGVLF